MVTLFSRTIFNNICRHRLKNSQCHPKNDTQHFCIVLCFYPQFLYLSRIRSKYFWYSILIELSRIIDIFIFKYRLIESQLLHFLVERWQITENNNFKSLSEYILCMYSLKAHVSIRCGHFYSTLCSYILLPLKND